MKAPIAGLALALLATPAWAGGWHIRSNLAVSDWMLPGCPNEVRVFQAENMPVHFHQVPIAAKASSGWSRLLGKSVQVKPGCGLMVRLEVDAAVTVSTQTATNATSPVSAGLFDSRVLAQAAQMDVRPMVDGVQGGPIRRMIHEARNQISESPDISYVGVENRIEGSYGWTWIIPAGTVHGVVEVGFDWRFSSNVGGITGIANSDGSLFIYGAQAIVQQMGQ